MLNKSRNNFFEYFKLPEMRSFLFFLPMVLAFFIFFEIGEALQFNVAIFFIFNVIFFTGMGFLLYMLNLRLMETNKSVKKDRAELDSVIITLQDAIIAYDSDFKIFVFNKVAESLFNLRADEIMGKIWTPEKVNEPRFKIFIQAMFPSLAPAIIRRSEPGVYPQVIDISFRDGKLELRTATNKIFDSQKNLIGFVKIISNRTREAELIKSKNEFIGVAAHQLRTPLTAVSWAFETLSGENLSENEKQIVISGAKQSKFVLKIIDDLLDVAQIESGRFDYNFKRVDIVFILDEIVAAARKAIEGSTLKINFEKLSKPIEFSFDANKISIALQSIINNAIIYNVKNGEIFISVEKLADKPYVQIMIKDTGIGILAGDLGKIFTKFFRADNAIRYVTNGSGLALFIAKNIIRRHGGEIKVESEINRGSTFYITLPTDVSLIPPKEFGYLEE